MSTEQTAAFATRLRDVLIHEGITEPAEQAARVATGAQVSESTARRWLAGRCRPGSVWAAGRLCNSLGGDGIGSELCHRWLFGDDGLPPKEWQRFRNVWAGYLRMNPWEQGQFHRLGFRLANRDPKARRVGALFVEGKVSRTQLLAAM